MIGVILDTNIYGRIIEDKKQGLELAERIVKDPDITVHNFQLIRKELRGAPNILPIYDKIVANRIIEETKDIKDLAQDYYKEYKINNGKQGKKKMMNDFKIVACATLKNCDLVVSEDKKTLLHPASIKSYKITNLRNNRRTPGFFSYKDLKKKYF